MRAKRFTICLLLVSLIMVTLFPAVSHAIPDTDGCNSNYGTTHNWSLKEGQGYYQAPTCVSAGYQTWVCSYCGKTVKETLPATDVHTYEETVSQAPTCTADGWQEYICTVCGAERRDPVPATGHTWKETVSQAPTCITAGWQEYICTGCGTERRDPVPATGVHTWEETVSQAPTCEADGWQEYICTGCGAERRDTVASLGGHQWDGGTVTQPAKCLTAGVKTYTCTRCGATKTEAIPATGVHTWEKTVSQAPTCEADGWQEYMCSGCGAERRDPIPATGHSYEKTVSQAPTCTADGWQEYICTNCGGERRDPVPATGHTWKETTFQEPTCVSKGWIEYICTTCGTERRENVPATGKHTYEETVSQAPTCTADGWQEYICTTCGGERRDMIPATGHTFEETVSQAPTCEEDGWQEYICTRCGLEERGTVPALGHDWDEGEVTKKETALTAGEKVYTCKRCGATKTEVIPANSELLQDLRHKFRPGKQKPVRVPDRIKRGEILKKTVEYLEGVKSEHSGKRDAFRAAFEKSVAVPADNPYAIDQQEVLLSPEERAEILLEGGESAENLALQPVTSPDQVTEEKVAGTWYGKIQNLAVSMTLNADATYTLSYPALLDEAVTGAWKLEGGSVLLDEGADTIAVYENALYWQDGNTAFAQDQPQVYAPGEPAEGVSPEQFNGYWQSAYVEMDGLTVTAEAADDDTDLYIEDCRVLLGGSLFGDAVEDFTFENNSLTFSAGEGDNQVRIVLQLQQDGCLRQTVESKAETLVICLEPVDIQ